MGKAPGLQNISFLKIDNNDNIFAEAGKSRTMYLSKDLSKTWEKISKPFHNSRLSFKNVGRDGTIIYYFVSRTLTNTAISKDFGDTWIYQNVGKTLKDILPLDDGNFLAIDLRNELFISKDSMKTLQKVWSNPNPFGEDFNKIFQTKSGTIIIPPSFLGLKNDLLYSNDNGTSWEVSNIPSFFNQSDFTAIESAPNGTLWMLSRYSIYNSNNNGRSWEQINTPNPNLNSLLIDQTGIVRVQENSTSFDEYNYSYAFEDSTGMWQKDSTSHDIKWYSGNQLKDGSYLGWRFGLHKSNNLNNWEIADTTIWESGTTALTWVSEDTLFARAGHGIVRSIDRAKSWQYILFDSTHTTWSINPVSDRINGTQIFANNGSIYLSTNYGESFDKKITPPNSKGVANCAISPEGIFISSSELDTYVSDDFGVNWKVSMDSVSLYNFQFTTDKVWYAYKNFNTIRSTTLGKTWEETDPDYFNEKTLDTFNNLITPRLNFIHSSINSGITFVQEGQEIPLEYPRKVISDDQNNFLIQGELNRKNTLCITHDRGENYSILKQPIDTVWRANDADGSTFTFHNYNLSPENYIYIDNYSKVFRYSIPTDELNIFTFISDLNFSKEQIKIYPNPTQAAFTLSFPEKPKSESNLLIFNNLGQKVLEQRLQKNQINHQVNDLFLPEGIYFYIIKNSQAKVAEGKLIIRK